MIDWPQIDVSFRLADEDSVDCPDAFHEKVIQSRDNYRDNVTDQKCPAVSIHVEADAALHSGLGTGTQLAMSIAQGLDTLYGYQHPLEQLASFVGRGKRSALGVHGFQCGGFLVDGGKRQPNDLGTLVAHHTMNSDWRILLITPPDSHGLSGTDEEAAFMELDPMPWEVTSHLCRLVLMELLPALQEADFPAFSHAIYEYGAKVGDYFAPIQGGRYADPRMAELVDWLMTRSVQGVGQSSWGPSLFAFCEHEAHAKRVELEILDRPEWSDCRVKTVSALNAGTKLRRLVKMLRSDLRRELAQIESNFVAELARVQNNRRRSRFV